MNSVDSFVLVCRYFKQLNEIQNILAFELPLSCNYSVYCVQYWDLGRLFRLIVLLLTLNNLSTVNYGSLVRIHDKGHRQVQYRQYRLHHWSR